MTARRMERIAYFEMLSTGAGWLELRCRRPDGHFVKHWARTPEQADAIAHRRTTAGDDVYVGMAPRVGRDGEDQNRYAPLAALWTDCDTDRSVRKLDLFEPEPTAVVLSGGADNGTAKRHAYWRLGAPLDPETARPHLQRLAHHLEADAVSAEPARILRVPGSRHNDTGRVARLAAFTGESIDLAALTDGLPDAPPRVAAGEARTAKSTDEVVSLFSGHYTHADGRHDHFRSVVGVLLARCDRMPPDALLELAVAWAQAHTTPCKDREELVRNFDNLLARERMRRGQS